MTDKAPNAAAPVMAAASPSVAIASDGALNLDAISLAQALRDVEIANSRVIDLTRRLATASKELASLRSQLSAVNLDALNKEIGDLRAELAAVRVKNAKDAAYGRRAG